VVPPSVTQRCSMWWLASRPPTLLPASPAVFSITMRSCGVVNLPTMALLSPFPSVLCLYISPSHPLLSSSPHSQTHTATLTDYFPLHTSCHVHSIHFRRSKGNLCLFPTRLCPFSSSRPLTQLLGALAVARQLSKFHQSVKVAFSSHRHSCR